MCLPVNFTSKYEDFVKVTLCDFQEISKSNIETQMLPVSVVVIDPQPSVFGFPIFVNVQVISADQTAAIVPHKHSAAELSSCKALPNTYTKLKGSEKKGEVRFDCLTGLQNLVLCILFFGFVLFFGFFFGAHN